MQFTAELIQTKKTATGIQVPEEIVAGLGSGKRPAVTVTFNGFMYRTTVAPMGGEYWIPVSAEVRDQSGATAGDRLEVTIELDTAPRAIEAPEDLTAALGTSPAAKAHWESLSYSKQRAIVLNLEGTKNPETRQRRLDKALADLIAGKP